MTIQSQRSNLQNRVDPWGNLHVASERGEWMGNRGILHNDAKEIEILWKHEHWVTCLLRDGESPRKGKTARGKLFTPGNYSELFFLDEATAFAAGHRPCSTCRNRRYKEFKEAWTAANPDRVSSNSPSFKEMDKIIQADRVFEGKKKVYSATLETLPDGTMIELNGKAFLIWRSKLYHWSFEGYMEDRTQRTPTTPVKVLTPVSIVEMYCRGFVPQVHVSAFWK